MGTTWRELTSNFPGNNRHSCFPWSSPAFPTAGRERASSFQEIQRHFWKRNKGFYSWQWRIAWASLHLCDKGVHALEFPLSLFSGCKVLLRSSKWGCLQENAQHVGRSQSRHVGRNFIFLTRGTHFAFIKLKKEKNILSGPIKQNFPCTRFLYHFWASCHLGLSSAPQRKKNKFWARAPRFSLVVLFLWGQHCGLKRGVNMTGPFPLAKKRILRNLTGLKRLNSFLGRGA